VHSTVFIHLLSSIRPHLLSLPILAGLIFCFGCTLFPFCARAAVTDQPSSKTNLNTVIHATSHSLRKPNASQTPSGHPVPRFVSLKAGKTNCRVGPSLNHPTKLSFQQIGLPVLVIAETMDHWRKIIDVDGDECWVHATLLSGRRTVISVETSIIYAQPHTDALHRASLSKGVIGRLHKCQKDWCQITVQKVKGWLPISAIWGADSL